MEVENRVLPSVVFLFVFYYLFSGYGNAWFCSVYFVIVLVIYSAFLFLLGYDNT